MVREKIDKDGNVITVGDLVFEDGILGQGSTASVRLARRIEPPKPPELVQVVDASAGKTIPNEFSAVPSDLDPSLSEKDELVPKTIASPTSTLIRDDVIETHDLTSQKPLNPPQSEPSIPSIQTEPSVTSSEESSDEKKTKSDVHDLVEKVGSTIVKVASDITANGRDTKATSDVQELVGTFGNKIADVANDLVEKASDIAEKATSTIQQVIQKEPDKNEKKDELVAVKIFNKSILKRMRTMERDSATRRMRYRTAFENVEKEIAIMKRMRHPNIVRLIEVIDSEDSDSLYMVLEYVPKGEIMTFIPELECFKRMPKKGEDANNMAGVVQPAGYFDETHAALYFVDILHGLAYLHQHHICHRDLKPENILLDANGVVKITDLGVSHFFEDVEDKNFTKSSLNLATGDATNGNGAESYHRQGSYDRPLGKLNRTLTESALSLKSMSSHGLLKKTEGTYCFWSPEMCSEDSSTYSGYAADMWAAGVCLITLATGKLPYYSEDCLKLFDMIADDEIDFEHFVDCAGEQVFLSNNLKNLMSLLLTKDPDERAGVGDCLSHPFLRLAREQRLDLLSDEFERSKLRKLIISEEDIRKAFAIAKLEATTAIVSKYIKLRSKLLDARATISQRSLKASESDSSITSDVSSSSDAPGVNSDVPSSLETPGFLTQTNDILNNNKAFRRFSLLSHVSEETFMSEEQTRRSSLSFGFEQTWNPNQRETEQEQDDQGPGMEKMGFLNENDSIVSEGDADTLTNLRNQSSRGFKMFKSRSMEDLKNFKTKSTRGLKRLKSSLPFRGHYSKFDSDDSETKWWKGRKLKNILRRFRKKAK